MCQYCHLTSGHLPGCPNEDDPEPITYCDYSEEPIYSGDTVIKHGGKTYLANKLSELTVIDLLDLFDVDYDLMEI